MFEHPYLSRIVSTFEQEEIVRAAERRRFLREHADQIVRRPDGRIRRMLRRALRSSTAAVHRDPVAPETATAMDSVSRAASGCDPTAMPAR